MKATYFWFCHEAFGTQKKQVHIQIEGDKHYYRIFGEGVDRYVRRVETGNRQPKVTNKKFIRELLRLADQAESAKVCGKTDMELK